MLSSIKQVKVGCGIPMLCIRSIVHYTNIYSRIVIQLNMYVKIITSSGFKSTILTDFMQGQLRVPFRFGRCLKFPGNTLIYREVVVSSAGSSTTRAARHKMEKKIGAEFMTSVSYRPGVIIYQLLNEVEQNIVICRATDKSRYFARTQFNNCFIIQV
jgi:hypothetical protein